MKKMLIAAALGLACIASLPTAQAHEWTGHRIGLIGSGAVLGTLVAGPIGTVIGAAIGDKFSDYAFGDNNDHDSLDQHNDMHDMNVSSAGPVNHVDSDESLAPFDKTGEASVYFSVAGADLTTQDKSLLHEVADVLKSNAQYNIFVIGAADPRGRNGYDNLALSKRRADSVKLYLEEEGISPERIRHKGIGPIESDSGDNYHELRVAKLRLVMADEPTMM